MDGAEEGPGLPVPLSVGKVAWEAPKAREGSTDLPRKWLAGLKRRKFRPPPRAEGTPLS